MALPYLIDIEPRDLANNVIDLTRSESDRPVSTSQHILNAALVSYHRKFTPAGTLVSRPNVEVASAISQVRTHIVTKPGTDQLSQLALVRRLVSG
jgi:hypothetical protein